MGKRYARVQPLISVIKLRRRPTLGKNKLMADNYPSPRQTGPYDTPGNTPANAAVRDVTVDPTAPPRPLPGTTTFSPIPVSGQHGEGAAQPLPPIAPAGPSPAVRPL